MFGVIVNTIAIVVGSLFGVLFRKAMNEKISSAIKLALGFCTLVVGMKMALKFENVLLLVGSITAGGIVGTWLELEKKTEALGERIKKLVGTKGERQFALGFSFASILYCVGALAVLGPINSAKGDHELLLTKSMLDGIIAIPLSALYGIGVAFSALPVFVYQGLIALLASHVQMFSNAHVMNELSGVGGLMVLMIGVNLTNIGKVPVGDFFPAVLFVFLVAPFIY